MTQSSKPNNKKTVIPNILCRYYYYPIMVPLTEQEFKEYCRLTTEIGSAYFLNSDENKILNDRQKKLLLQRKRIINGAENKKHILINIINEIGVEKLKYCLV